MLIISRLEQHRKSKNYNSNASPTMTDATTTMGITNWISVDSVVSYDSDTESDVDIVDAKEFLTDLDEELHEWIVTDIEAAQRKNAKLRALRDRRTAIVSRLLQQAKKNGAKRMRDEAAITGQKRQCVQVDFDAKQVDCSLSSQGLRTVVKSRKLEALEVENAELERGNDKLALQIARLRRAILAP